MKPERTTRKLVYISNENNKNSMHLGDGYICTEEQDQLEKVLKSNQFLELKFKMCDIRYFLGKKRSLCICNPNFEHIFRLRKCFR